MAAALLASSSTSAEDSGLLPEGPVTLLELLDIALIANSDIALTYDRSRRADGMLAEAKASFWPMVRPYSTIHYGNYPHIIVAQLIDTHEFGNDENLNLPGINTIYEVGAELLIGVYERGQRKLHREMAETAKNLCTADYQVAVNSVAKDVIDGFFSVLAGEELVETAEKAVPAIRAILDEVSARFEAGSALGSEVAQAELAFREAEQAVVQARIGRGLAAAALATSKDSSRSSSGR